MEVLATELKGVLLIKPRLFHDERGCFFETWHRNRYQEAGLPTQFAQDNVSVSKKGVLRGLHYQVPHSQGKLVSVIYGEIFDVAVDTRLQSPTFGRWVGYKLSHETGHQLWIPEGFAHGFCVLSDVAHVSYKCTEFYSPKDEKTLLWNDPALNIKWPVTHPIVSEKDKKGVNLKASPTESLPSFL